jgi:hypothetical protein
MANSLLLCRCFSCGKPVFTSSTVAQVSASIASLHFGKLVLQVGPSFHPLYPLQSVQTPSHLIVRSVVDCTFVLNHSRGQDLARSQRDRAIVCRTEPSCSRPPTAANAMRFWRCSSTERLSARDSHSELELRVWNGCI